VRVYSFQIDPEAQFRRRLRRTGDSDGLFARLLSLLGSLAPGKKPNPAAKSALRLSRRSRKEPARIIAAPVDRIIAARQTRYGIYAISTSQLADGRWVASFGRQDGKPMYIDGKHRSLATMRPYFAESLAIANAQAFLDALAAPDAAANLSQAL
jgi:hypothetical protein